MIDDIFLLPDGRDDGEDKVCHHCQLLVLRRGDGEYMSNRMSNRISNQVDT